MFTQRQLEHILIGSKTLSAEDLHKYTAAAEAKGAQLEDYLIGERLTTEDNLYETAASLFQLPFVKTKNQPIRKDILFLIPEPLAQHYQIAAVDTDGDKVLKVITTDPENLQAFEFLKKKTGKELSVSITTPSTFREIMKQYHKSLQAEFQELTTIKKAAGEGQAAGEKNLQELAEDLPIIRIVDTML